MRNTGALARTAVLAALLGLGGASAAWGAEEVPVRSYKGIIHVHSTFSTGELTPAEIVEKAKQAGISIVVFTDHDAVRASWGVPPFRNLFSRTFERAPGILTAGVDAYYDTIEALQRNNPNMVILPGVEVAPFYYITGNPITGTATVHDWRRHIILLGLGREAVKNLPVPLNGLSTRYFWTLLPGTLLFLIPTFLSLFLILFRGWLRWVGMAIFLVGLLGTIDAHPFKPTPFNPYLGPQGARPYQEIIDYAEEKGGIALWAHQGSRLHKTKAGPVFLETKPYTHLLLETIHFRGLDAIYEDRFTASKPGQQWDMLLSAYAQKRIPYPVWGYGGLDFHSEKELNGKKRLSDILTVFALRKLSEDAVLRALVNGRFYVVRSYSPSRLKMDHFSISSRDGKIKGSYGEALKFKGPPKISFQISTEDGKSVKVKVKLIRLGEVIKFIEGPTPLRVDYTDPDEIKATSLYYRIDAKVNNREHLITNPVFIHR